MGAVPAIRSYIIIVLGGMGSIPGSILGGIVIGLVESFGAGYFPDGQFRNQIIPPRQLYDRFVGHNPVVRRLLSGARPASAAA